MRIIAILLILTGNLSLSAQSKRIETQIAKLNNTQFVIDHSVKSSFSMNSQPAHKLIKIGKPAVEKLIEALSDPNKIIMAHLVLCHIYFKHASFAGPKEQTREDISIYKYFLGQEKGEGLILSEVKKDKNYVLYIEPNDQENIIIYWKNKTKN